MIAVHLVMHLMLHVMHLLVPLLVPLMVPLVVHVAVHVMHLVETGAVCDEVARCGGSGCGGWSGDGARDEWELISWRW